nr:MAG TPA: hypothetical protein [Caudoviricetes sp.]DAX26894.1 MAG TPA: hypothetical protein [Caudoviricetes sp.]
MHNKYTSKTNKSQKIRFFSKNGLKISIFLL